MTSTLENTFEYWKTIPWERFYGKAHSASRVHAQYSASPGSIFTPTPRGPYDPIVQMDILKLTQRAQVGEVLEARSSCARAQVFLIHNIPLGHASEVGDPGG